jgi:hypothetical protein
LRGDECNEIEEGDGECETAIRYTGWRVLAEKTFRNGDIIGSYILDSLLASLKFSRLAISPTLLIPRSTIENEALKRFCVFPKPEEGEEENAYFIIGLIGITQKTLSDNNVSLSIYLLNAHSHISQPRVNCEWVPWKNREEAPYVEGRSAFPIACVATRYMNFLPFGNAAINFGFSYRYIHEGEEIIASQWLKN